MTKIDIEDGLALMSRGFEKVVRVVEGEEPDLGGSFTVDDYISLHSALFKLCSVGPDRKLHAHRLFSAYSAAFHSHLSSKSISDHHHYDILRQLRRQWDHHSVTARWLSRLLNYLDRSYLLRSGLPSLADSATISFRDTVFHQTKSAAASAVVALVAAEREGRSPVDAAAVREAGVELFVVMGMGELSVYESDLEAPLLDSAAAFYSREAASWTDKAEIAVPAYVAMAEKALESEVARVARYLHPTTEPKIVEVVRRELLVAPAERIFHDERFGFSALVRADDVDTLRTVYGLYVEIPEELRRLAELFRRHVEAEGMEILRGESSSTVTIARLIEIQKRYKVYSEKHFEKHEFFETARTDAFKEFINANPTITVELLAAFCEEILGDSKRTIDEAADQDALDDVVGLLEHVKDKDVFVERHRKNLSNRLLFGQRMNGDSENSLDKFFVGKMKQGIGDCCTQKLEGMLNDIRISRENDKEVSKKSPSIGGVSLSVSVLTPHRWPVPFKAEKLSIPAEMEKCIESFTGFYGTKFESRRLTFVYSLGNCHVDGNFDAESFTMIVTPYQAVVMMLFNDSDELSYSEICEGSKIDDEAVLRAALHSLSSAKYSVLTKSSDDDVFRFNPSFKGKEKLFQIPMPKIAEKEAEKKTGVEINNNRRFCIDAAIVRIMKSRKELGYQQLLAQCIDQLKSIFVPDVKDVKKRIETLIERDFIERDERDANLLHYIA